jgi:hypothetical protein
MSEPESFRYSKKHLCVVLGISRVTLNRKMKFLQPEIAKLFPYYHENDKLLSPKMFNWICDQIGPEKDERIEIIRNNFASSTKNPFYNPQTINARNIIQQNRNVK